MLLRRYNSSRVLVQRCEYSLFHRTFHRTFQRMFHRKGVGSSPIFGHDPNVLGEYLAVYESTRHWGAGIRLPRTQCDDVLEHSEVAVPLLDLAALHTRMHARTHACTYTHTHAHARTHAHPPGHAHTRPHTHAHACAHGSLTHTCSPTRACTHTCTHGTHERGSCAIRHGGVFNMEAVWRHREGCR